MARIKMHIPKAKLPFYPPYEVKYRLQNGVSTVPCGTAPLFMNVCFILSDSSLHDWVLKTHLSFSAVVILLGLCCVSQGSPGSGIL